MKANKIILTVIALSLSIASTTKLIRVLSLDMLILKHFLNLPCTPQNLSATIRYRDLLHATPSLWRGW